MNKKFYKILFIFIFFTILFYNKSLASFNFTLDNKEYTFPDFPSVSSGYSQYDFIILNDSRPVSYLMFLPKNFSGKVAYSSHKLYFLNNNNYTFKTYHLNNNTWVDDGYSYYYNNLYCSFLYSTEDIYDNNGTVFFNKTNTVSYSIELSTNDNTNSPVIAYSNYFSYSDVKKYKCYISSDSKSWNLMNYETFNDTVNNTIKFRFNYKIFENGCYYFKFLNTENNEEYLLSYNITNIIKNSSNSSLFNNSIPQAFCTYERVNNEFIIKTQSFTSEEIQKYQVLYTNTISNDYSSWNKMSIGSYNNSLTGEVEYYFFFTVPADSEDCIYYFIFYDYNLNEYGDISSMNCFFDEMNKYADSLSPTISEKGNKFQELLNYFKDRFGFLTYPFEFLIDFFNRVLNINYSEPVLHIPELKEPFSNNKILDSIDYNFNSLLENNTFSYLYNIYLIAVDFIIIVLFIFLCKKVIEEVFSNG